MKKLEYTIQKIEFIDDHSKAAVATIQSGEAKFEIKIDNDGAFDIPKELKLVESLVGIFDPKPLADQYEKMANNIEAIRLEQRKERRRKAYRQHWVHGIKDPGIEGMEIKPTRTEEEYVNQNDFHRLHIEITYKCKKADIKYEEIYSDSVWRRSSGKFMYVMIAAVSNYNRRNYKSFENAAKKFKELVDDAVEAEEVHAKAGKEAAIQRQETINALTDEFGRTTCEKEWKSGYGPGRGYYTWIYYIHRDENKYSISVNGDGSYDFRCFTRLSAAQIRGILDILHPTS